MARACCSSALTATKRMVGRLELGDRFRVAASFFWRLRTSSRKGAVTRCDVLRFPSPLIKPDVRISRIRLSDWLHRKAHGGDTSAPALKAQHAQLPVDMLTRELLRATPWHFVSFA